MTASYQTITFSDADAPVALLTLNRPDKRNPIGPLTCGELVHALGVAGARDDLACIVITGAGTVFSAGGDLAQMGGGAAGDGSFEPASMVTLLTTMHGVGKPIVAMVNGHALAGGLGLMVACDLVVASAEATFGTTEIKLGLWPMMITAELVRNVGRKRTLELMLTGKRIDATEAERIGLVNRVVARDVLERETMALARQIASMSPTALRMGLRAFYDTQDMDLEPALRTLETRLAEILATEDAREGIAAFLGKRPPVWTGR